MCPVKGSAYGTMRRSAAKTSMSEAVLLALHPVATLKPCNGPRILMPCETELQLSQERPEALDAA